MIFALAGNQNCGKTTLFNALTGANQHVGNFPGVTVEKKEGTIKRQKDAVLVDLPGIYSLSPYSMEEVVARDFLLEESPDLILNLVDATSLERSLYLTLQLMELELPMVVALNMMDELEQMGDELNLPQLTRQLGLPVVPISAKRGEGMEQLLEQIQAPLLAHRGRLPYDPVTCWAYDQMGQAVSGAGRTVGPFICGKLLEGDREMEQKLALTGQERQLTNQVAEEYTRRRGGQDSQVLLADARYSWIEQLMRTAVRRAHPAGALTLSDQIDRLVTGKYTAIPIFLLVLYTMFAFTFSGVGEWMKERLGWFTDVFLGNALEMLLFKTNAPGWCASLLREGVLGGVGSVLSFLPQILLLFLFLSLLEDSGYMARAAFLMDRVMARFGLNGKAFIPMLMGFGCTTPAVMAARTMENERERRLTILLIPFMSCGAKLPIYALFAGAFFPRGQGAVVFGCYLFGLLLAMGSGLLLKNTLFRGGDAPFLMELPPYRLPVPLGVLRRMWEKCKGFLWKAGTVILSMSVVVWLLQSLTPQLHWAVDGGSIFEALGRAIAPLLAPLGFGSWQAAVSLLTGLAAKETVVSTMMVLYEAGSTAELQQLLTGLFSPGAALSFLTFSLLYTPCMAALASMRRELGSWGWTLFSAAYQLCVAYTMAWLVYRLGSLLPL